MHRGGGLNSADIIENNDMSETKLRAINNRPQFCLILFHQKGCQFLLFRLHQTIYLVCFLLFP